MDLQSQIDSHLGPKIFPQPSSMNRSDKEKEWALMAKRFEELIVQFKAAR